jgi:hypothetical protein
MEIVNTVRVSSNFYRVAVPTRSGNVTLFKPNSSVAAQEYELPLHERTLKVNVVKYPRKHLWKIITSFLKFN